MTAVRARLAQGGLAVLVDPDRTTADDGRALARRAEDEGCVALLVGTSFGGSARTQGLARAIREVVSVPILQFPAMASDLVADVDAVLLLSLVSGRNPQYLIEEHVRAVPFFDRHPAIEVISTAYCLIDGGRVTSVEAVSQTRPLPADKPELVRAHVRAGAMIGMSAAYLDAGSGARTSVAPPLVRAARDATSGLILVGGGIGDGDGVRAARAAGADVVVVGSLFEREGARSVRALALAARG